MNVVSAFLTFGSPLPFLRPDNPPWRRLAAGYRAAGRALLASRPDTVLVYSTQWIAVLDALWQARVRLSGTHVDENWYEYGDLDYDIRVDREVVDACVEASGRIGIRSRPVDYEGFPVDTGTIVANRFMNARGLVPLVMTANNMYHGWDETCRLGALASEEAGRLGRRVAVLGIGGLSGTLIREDMDIREDGIAFASDDQWNRRILGLLERGDSAAACDLVPEYAGEARVDMGFKHFAWLLGAVGGRFRGARVHAYGAVHGSGAAIVEFRL